MNPVTRFEIKAAFERRNEEERDGHMRFHRMPEIVEDPEIVERAPRGSCTEPEPLQRPHHASKPITVHGTLYPSRRAAAKAIGVGVSVISKAIRDGTLDKVGFGPKWHTGAAHHNSKPITIRGVEYVSCAAAAKALKISEAAVYSARKRGTLDRIGRQKRRKRGDPVTIHGIEYPSVKAAAKALGVTTSAVYRAEKEGRADQLLDEDAVLEFNPAESPDYDADGNLTAEAYAERLADFRRRRAAQ